jgi:hypothetical protein
MPKDIWFQVGIGVLVILIVVTFVWLSELFWRRTSRFLADEPDRDPYIEQVRAMRAMPGVQPGCAVSIQDPKTGEFFYYPCGSETRMIRHQNNKLHIDFEHRD